MLIEKGTSKIQPYSFEYAGAKITLADTPGFDDTAETSDTDCRSRANVPDLEAGHDREVGHRLHQNYKI